MKPLLLILVSAAVGAASPEAGNPQSCRKQTCPAPPSPPLPQDPPIVWVEKTVTLYRPELRPHDFKDTVEQLNLHRETAMEKYLVPELVPVPALRKMCIPRLVPRQIEIEVC